MKAEEPNTTIMGGTDMHINRGSTINLTCIVEHSPEPPSNILWTHNNQNVKLRCLFGPHFTVTCPCYDPQEINYDSPRGGVSVITEKGDVTVSYLLIQKARASDSGKYACAPSNAITQEITVHVLNGELPAAMQHGGQLKLEYPLTVFLLSVSILILGT
ncbi:unnamed protein product [Allacma fusca]|uniref:Ig-like domain-containing protein n=1 Tax=Allacma fusca TaxID=39272 RepID=A0A8J2LPF6_9HEXA|nr:unnamed protein product [Allacma fusca]